MNNKTVFAILFITWIITISISCVIPKFSIQEIGLLGFEFRGDYVLHFFSFFTGSLLLMHWTLLRDRFTVKRCLLNIVLIMLLGISLEFIQKIVPGRSFNPFDLYFNMGGSFFGGIVYLVVKRKAINQ